MYISKKDRELIRNKFGGKCAYSGTDLLDDWQIDHIKPVIRNWFSKGAMFEDCHNIDNMVPCQKIINHYKGSLGLESFRSWFLGELHIRLSKFPKNSNSPKTLNRKKYLMEVASFFDITVDKPFSGVFYFETLLHDENL